MARPIRKPPTSPSNLTATPVSQSQINLSWTGSTDNVGVTGYRLERCQGASCSNFVEIATPSGTSHPDTGLSPATTYRYRVRAADAAGNLSGYSNIASATTQTGTTPTPVAAYSFNEGSGTTVADASGTGNAGTIGTATWTTQGKFGNALSFNGTSARVTVPDASSLDLTTAMTLEAWVNPTALGWLARCRVQGQRRLLPGGLDALGRQPSIDRRDLRRRDRRAGRIWP